MSIVLLVILIICFVLIISLYSIGIYLYYLALDPKTSKSIVLGKKEKTEEERLEIEQKNKKDQKWLKEKSKEVYILSDDNLKLHGYEMNENKNSSIWVIVVHGYTNSAEEMVDIAKRYIDMGYRVLMINLRSHGKSEGSYIGMGWPDRLDLLKWISYLIEQNKEAKIILYGISMGASTVMMTTGENIPSNVKLAIEDCGYTSVWDEFANTLKLTFKLPTFPILNVANQITKNKAGYDFKEASAIEQIKKSKTPTLFIHGDKDKFVPFWMLDKLYEAAKCEKQKLVIEGAKHAQSSEINQELYWNTIEQFIKKYIK